MALRALDHAETVVGRAWGKVFGFAERARLRCRGARHLLVRAPNEVTPHPKYLGRHFEAVREETDPRIIVVGELHGEALHPMSIGDGRREDLEVESEAVDRSHREELLGDVATERLQAAL